MAEHLFLGVDGGGSRTRARLRDEAGRLLGEAEAGAGNARLGDAGFNEVMTACRRAVAVAGLGEDDLARIHAGFGLAGTQQDVDRQSVLDRDTPFAALTVDTDAYAAYLGAHRGRDGGILILGTGSCGLAVIGGRRINVGGWGADIGDDGSGMAIGRLAIRRSLWALEGMAPMTRLAEDVLAVFAGQGQNAVLWAAEATPGDFAAFAPRVFDHAEAGDELAEGVIEDAARDATMLIERLLELGSPSVAMIGSVFPRLLRWLPDRLGPLLVEPESDATDGAILMAQRSLEGIGTGRP